MKKFFIFFSSIFLFQLISQAQSPRLILTSERIGELKSAVNIADSHHDQLFRAIRNRVNANDINEYDVYWKPNYARSFWAVEAALMYVMTDSSHYAQKAYDLLELMYTSGNEGTPTIPDLGSWPPNPSNGSKALTYAFPTMAYGLCHDWARSGWTTPQKQYVLDSIKAGLDDWEALFRWELYNMPTSNWNSVCRGAELMMMVGGGEEVNRPARYEELKSMINNHYELSYGPSGYSYEGVGYIHYGVPFSYAAMYALQSIGDTGINSSFNDVDFYKLLMYNFAFTADQKHLMTGVDGAAAFGEGLFGLVFGDRPADEMKYYKYFYDHFIGVHSNVPDSEKFDQSRLGAVWNYIFYPENLNAENPTNIWSEVLVDQRMGAYFLRNRFKNEHDILFDIIGKYERHDYNSWMMAETFNFSLTAHDNLYIGQTGKNYNHSEVSSLLVDNLAWGTHSKPHRDTGYLEFFEAHDDGAYVVINGGQKYDRLGVDNAKRHCYVKFNETDSSCIIAMLDQLSASTPRSFKWQINVGDNQGMAGINVQTGTENGHPYFLLTGENNGYVKGWSANLTAQSFTGTDPLYIEPPYNTSADIFVVMKIGQGSPPSATFSGSGMNTTVNSLLNNHQVGYDDINDQVYIDLVSDEFEPFAGKVKAFRVFPVPATQILNIDFPDERSGRVDLVHLNGSVIQQYNFEQKLKIDFDVSDVAEGFYLLDIQTNDHQEVHSIVIK